MKSSTEYEYLSKSGGAYKKVYSPDNPGPLYLITHVIHYYENGLANAFDIYISVTDNTIYDNNILNKLKTYIGYIHCNGIVTYNNVLYPITNVYCNKTELQVYFIETLNKLPVKQSLTVSIDDPNMISFAYALQLRS